ncbi:amino acid adenylation domain-containing protein, partial [Longimicrobium sp.]|uniref:amino acid adenylation domain-containing protein n=1 Tax=Longimicrobium sp. TaxID=2029185 RepID=UPI0039C8C88A
PALRTITVAGEALPAELVERWGARHRLWNLYGPTEATIWSTAAECAAPAAKPDIGAPIANVRAYVLDAALGPVPVGVPGELYLGGAGVARGYLGRPGLTAERFAPDPFGGEPGARLYRTGDRVRRLADGRLDFIGRMDDQVKVRGFRIEPGEIEARLAEHAAVREAVVVVREDATGDRRLVAYVVASARVEADALRAYLGERLPEHMVPAAYVHLDALPLTPNGKVDRKALPAPEGGAYARRGYEAPVGKTERALAEIWSELLGVEQPGRWDHFFELGGHSLLAVRVTSRVRQVLGAELALADLFQRPVLADLARTIEDAARTELPPIERVDRAGRLPLSFAQQRLWFLEQLDDLGGTYHIPTRLRLGGELDGAALRRALDAIVARHEALRTTFVEVDGEPVQRIAEESPFHLLEHDLGGHPDSAAELRRLSAEEANAPFDLERGPPIRGRLVRLAEDDHVLLMTMHHIVSDAWSMEVLTRELRTLYDAFRRGDANPLVPLPVQYADYAAWQRKWVAGEVLREQAEYWTRTLAGAPELLELPADRPRPARQDHAGGTVGISVDEELSAALKELSRRHGATLFMTVLAGWAAVLGRISGQDDVVVGTPTANRGRTEVEGLIGFFVNTLALRVDLSGPPTVAELLEQVRARSLGAQQHQDIPFEQVVELVQPVRSMAHSPLFQVMFAWQNASQGPPEVPGARLEGAGAASQAAAKFDLSLSMGEAGERIAGSLTYATSLFERATIERHLAYLRRVLEAFVSDDLQAVDAIPLLPEAERRRVLEEWSAGEAAHVPELCIHELFQAQARLTPGAVALVHADETLAYAELDARANRLAHHLRSLGVEPEARVGVFLEWGPELVVALLAVLKAGGVYVPLDPSLPDERLAFMAEDAGAGVVVTRDALAGRLAVGVTVRVDADAERIAVERGDAPASDVAPEGLAYLIYTSGSTGRPKGVAVEHRAAATHFRAMAATLEIVREDRVLQFASAGFDVSLEQVFLPLLTGATLVLRGAELWSPAEFAGRARSLGVTVANLPPAYWQEVLATGALPEVRLLLVGGDALPTAAAAAGDATRLLNCYGPTEAVVTATAFAVPGGFAEGFAGSAAPIGRPLPGRSAYVLDVRGAPVPPGVAGELFLGGLLARGYLGRPGLTAERFVPDPFGGAPGARLYRTGDRARWRESAEVRECVSAEVNPVPNSRTDALTHSRTAVLEFLGRIDFQVKVRGFRIELGEIEARLREHASVREAVVAARAEGSGDTRLVAYVVGSDSVEVEALRSYLSERLPEYMVPAAYVRLDALPLTPSGKVDRKALPAPDGDAYARGGYEAPVGETEQALAEVWSELLGVERVGRWDNFFELGGHSLLAVRVISRVRQVMGAEVGIGGLFERPVLADFARGVQEAARTNLPPIETVQRSGALPLSFAQQRLWFLHHMNGAGTAYHIPTRLRLRGELHREALVRALERIVARHEALRTRFPASDGVPAQRIAPVKESRFPLAEYDLGGDPQARSELQRLLGEEARAPFDLEQGPLIRGQLIRLAADDHVLVVTMHHIVSDGWSMGVFTRELGALYDAFRRGEPDPLPPLPVQYADYAAWQRKWVDGDVLRQQAEYWTETLTGAPELLELPTDHPRPMRRDQAGASVGVVMDEALTAGLKALGQRHGTTLFMTVLAAWAAVLGRLSGQPDVVVGTPTANRGRTEIEGLIGFFVNTLAVRVDLAGSPTLAELLVQVRARSLGAQQNQDIPFEQVVELVQPARSLAHNPVFQVMLTWQNAPEGGLELPGLRLAGVDAGSGRATAAAAKVDLSLTLWEAGGRIVGSATYATALFEQATVERWVGYLRRVLDAMVADDAQPVDRLELLDEAERSLVLEEWNRAERDVPRNACVHELFEAQVARTPDAVAVVFEDRSLTYAELNDRANRLAHHLRGRGVGPDVRVAVCIERSPELMIAFLAVLKAGGAYVPLDPGDPEDRLRHMLDDGAPAALLVHAGTAARFAGEAIPVIDLDARAGDWVDEPAENPSSMGAGPALGHLAYVIYTSGSTGRPKGVMVEHRALANVMGWMGEAWPLGPGDVVLQKTPVSFDASARELFPPLLAGARMVIARPGGHRDPAYLAETIRREGVTTLHFVPTMFGFLLEEPGIERCTSVARVVCGGEALPAALARRAAELLPHAELHNVYGPTEAAVDVTWLRCPAEVAGPHVSIGRPMAGCRAYFLDRAAQPAPAGVAGELYLGGVQVARGYLGRPGLTAERFVPDPFGGQPGARLYRTGDLGRWRPDGTIEFLGRNDFQVKVRGFRIELGEIEARLREHASVREAVVVARENEAGDRRLVAYSVGPGSAEADALRAFLAERLPEHMVPAAYVRLDTFPLTSSGKVNRNALPAPEGDAFARRGYEAPLGEMEQALAEIWSELLDVERVGRGDNFFELGGHSLLAVRVISRVRQAMGAEVGIGDLFERPALADFARGLEQAGRADLPPIERVARTGRLPLSFAQQRLWFLEQMGGMGSMYHIPKGLRLRGELDGTALARALERIVERHEALRTTFHAAGGEPEQRIAPIGESGFHLAGHDLSAHPDAEAELRRLAGEEANAPFDLERGPLVRGQLIRLAEDDHVLLLTMHHIVSDGWSSGVLTNEMGALYGAFREGRPDPLPPLPVQYADYAAWQRKWVDGEVLREQAEYWTRTLAGAPERLELPIDRPRPARQDHAGALVGIDLGDQLSAGLKALSRRHGSTLHMTLLAGWAAVLDRLSGQGDVVVGTPSANRGRREIEGLIGFFVNTLALRIELGGSPSVSDLLRRVRERALEAQHHQDIPFEQVVELVQPARTLAHSPLFQVMFSWQSASESRLELPGLTLGGVSSASLQVAKFDLSLALGEAGGRIAGSLMYATSLFEQATIERHVAYLRRVLEAFAADDLQAVDALPLLPEAERRLVVEEWSAGEAAHLSGPCIHELFGTQARLTPVAAALVHADETLTYAELDARANRLAHHLRALGVGPEARVGVFLEWGPELVVALLAVLKAGGVYVPLDPSLPAERLAYMAEDAGTIALVTRAALAGRIGVDATVRVDADAERIGAECGDPPVSGVRPEGLAYLIYTSGSTGRPKGVGVEHGAAAAHFRAMAGALGIVREDRVLQFASSGFDVSLEQVFLPLLTGATLVLRGAELWSPADFAGRARSLGVTVANLPPAYWQEVLATGSLPGVRLLLVGGDALPTAAAAAGEATRLLNCYGPTEAVVTATAFAVSAGFAARFAGSAAPIGRPLPGRSAYVLDARGAPVPPGVAGELFLGGLLARGYLGRPGLTAERFVPDPFGGVGARLYRTGDRARWRESAEVRECVSAEVNPVPNSRTDALTHSRTAVLEFLGRADFQVKVRGFRIEPGEIEARLREHASVREAVVAAREVGAGDPRLVAYIVGPGTVEADALRAYLAERLPEYMLPAAYVHLDALPLTPSGKVDRKALPAPEGDAFATRGYEAPVGETEEALAGIWAEVLGLERVGRHDHFFELGGHSLLAVRVISRVRQVLGAEVGIADLFEKPVLSTLAQHVVHALLAQFDPEELARLGALLDDDATDG